MIVTVLKHSSAPFGARFYFAVDITWNPEA